jgi:hypothetical protein
MIAVLGDERPPMCVSDASAALSFEVAYWRKANAVHRWFVENVQNGVDDCQKVDVSLDQLRDLVGLCETLLGKRDAELAEEYLPTESGFFYGSTDYDDWYWDCLQLTVDQVKPLLMWFDEDPRRAAQWDVSYRSSW